MLSEHETFLDFAGREYPAVIRYERDPEDGYPVIHGVEMRCEIPSWDRRLDMPASETLVFDATKWLDKNQEAALEDLIVSALKADAAATLADRMAMESEDRAIRRAGELSCTDTW